MQWFYFCSQKVLPASIIGVQNSLEDEGSALQGAVT